MQNFKNWLNEAKSQISFSFWKDGTVLATINGKKYQFQTDTFYHEKWSKMQRFAPGRVLNDIKEMLRDGRAQQIQPSVKKYDGGDGCPICKTPYPNYVPGIECPGCGLHS